MQRLRKLKLWTIAPVAAWLIMQFVMTGVFAAAPGFGSRSAEAGIPQNLLVICTPEGLKTIAAPEAPDGTPDGTPEGGAPKPAKSGDGCFWCQAFGSAAAPPRPGGPVACDFGAKTVIYWPAGGEAPAPGAPVKGFQSRAPPA